MGLLSLINQAGLATGSTRPVPVGESWQRDPYAPNYELLVYDGQGASPFALDEPIKAFIEEITFESNADQFDHMEVKFANQAENYGGGQILSLLDDKLFSEGKFLEAQFGYGRSLMSVGACQIAKKHPDFPEKGFPSFTIEGYDLLSKLSRTFPKTGKGYVGMTYGKIVEEVAMRAGFVMDAIDPRGLDAIGDSRYKGEDIQDKKGQVKTQPKGQNDYVFLKKIAEINGFDLFSKFDPQTRKFVLFFQPPGTINQKEIFTFVYNSGETSFQNTLLSFQPTLDAHDQSNEYEIFVMKDKEVGGTSVDYVSRVTVEDQHKLKEDQERRGSYGKQKPLNRGHEYAFKAFGRSFRFPPNKRFKDENEARRCIEEFIKRQAENFITGTGKLIGLEALQARQIHNLTGLGEQFSGKYYFTQVKHVMSRTNGYSCEFACRKVIEDMVVQAPPALKLTELDKLFKKLKGED